MISRAEFISTAVDCGYASREKAERYAGDLIAADREIDANPDKYNLPKQPKPEPPKPRIDTTPTVTAYCHRCIYLCKNPALCSFAYYTGTTRPCPAGDGCIVRKTKGDRISK